MTAPAVNLYVSNQSCLIDIRDVSDEEAWLSAQSVGERTQDRTSEDGSNRSGGCDDLLFGIAEEVTEVVPDKG